ncbi:MAG TPA: hypothetical protein VG448_13430 [Solirubrobacterales bacterium]|nr:hypothetical protein [Solirubrobacterales bacterium]
MKRLGPELKMPKLKGGEMKVPPFLSDLYYDLRDRRLLPLVVLILIAIVATPILLGGGSDKPKPATPPAAIAGGAVPASQSLTVVQAEPGLRNYKKRLRHRSPTDPFHQRFDGPRLKGSQLNEPTTSTAPTTETPSSSPGSGGAPTVTSPTTTTVPGTTTHHVTYFTWGINVQITKLPSEEVDPEATPEVTTKERVLPQTPLPGSNTPVVTFLGLSRDAAEKKQAKALFLVSDQVSRVSDNAECVSAREGCQLIEAKVGSSINFIYGPGETRYTIKVLKLEVVVTGHSERHS